MRNKLIKKRSSTISSTDPLPETPKLFLAPTVKKAIEEGSPIDILGLRTFEYTERCHSLLTSLINEYGNLHFAEMKKVNPDKKKANKYLSKAKKYRIILSDKENFSSLEKMEDLIKILVDDFTPFRNIYLKLKK